MAADLRALIAENERLQAEHARLTEALTSAKAVCDNINEFGHVTDQQTLDCAETAIRRALGRDTFSAS